jgi:hypothetical protein
MRSRGDNVLLRAAVKRPTPSLGQPNHYGLESAKPGPNRCSGSPPPGNGRLWSNHAFSRRPLSRAFRPFIGLIRFFGRFPTLSASARHRPRAAAVASVRTSAQPGSRERSLPPTAQFRSMGGWSGRRPGLHRRPQAAPRRTSQGPPNHEPPSRQGGHGRGPRRASARPRVRPRLVQAANP